jgi:hypothetical protein
MGEAGMCCARLDSGGVLDIETSVGPARDARPPLERARHPGEAGRSAGSLAHPTAAAHAVPASRGGCGATDV